ncbi:cation diffusion facilitator family transporter [Aneurinibacillus thermoaerophilus]|uniref:Cobalt-zinc-cadmium efflux system protein n=1 Tax=Aneurinibacillus thermoaerophilus TaxID=143495 RepID=A0A1G8E1J6_ANETH|nr:cation diffusion facilitator family transporter [Aneurinibacillus thermoaerophilus]MED0758415.1 cation diffusion facilitator family transporter [Aneurinibacillus thermoaerophilus]MED0760426.1 cation diffusion facilitator family transporter [Aneurinibacillus thermoaerophilus]SDH63764.1 cobalt-zinc-cadmium efflux system protein [Aneurinibacillus thermoaerophilus]
MGGHHDHGHSYHGHGHHHHDGNANHTSLFLAFILITGFMIVEFFGGLLSNSLALISDAGHMLSDAASLFLSLFAMRLATKPTTATKTYGYKRTEILAALLNGITLIIISLYIFIEAYDRLFSPQPVASISMMTIAAFGLLINIAAAWILMRGGDTSKNLNVRSAFLHVLGDMLGSVGAIMAGLLIWLFGWTIADPIASIIVAVLILVSTWRIIRDSVNVLMEGVPAGMDVEEMRCAVLALEGVVEVHDLHVWTVTSGFPALSCHIVVRNLAQGGDVLRTANQIFRERFHISHTTIQIEDMTMCQEENICDKKGQLKKIGEDDDKARSNQSNRRSVRT